MKMRSAALGKTTTTNATLYYSNDGKMVTLTESPFKTIIINNASGELSIYNFDQNSVIKESNPVYSTQSNNLYFFLQNKKQDMGLADSGFSLDKTQFEDGLKITTWTSPAQISQLIEKVELVHNKSNPVYMAYLKPDGKFLKKIYFYGFADLKGIDFPTAITEITYPNEKDSILTKTTFGQFEFNESVDNEYLYFKIPSNATVVSSN